MKIINKLIDDQYDKSTITHTRKIARAILLNEENKVSLFVRFIDIETGNYESRIINKNK
jgi:hypothetical protein